MFGFLLAGCSALRLGYNNADTLALAYIDAHLELDPAQKEIARAGLSELFAWHRKHELPRYIEQLSAMQDALGREVSAADVEQLREFVRGSIDRSAVHALPHLLALARTLRPEQIAHLQKKLDKANKAFRAEHLEGSEDDLRTRRLERVVDQMERWFGAFSERQRLHIAEWVDAVPYDRDRHYAERQRRQQEFLALIGELRRAATTRERARRLVIAYAQDFESRPEAIGQGPQAQARDAGHELVARIVNHTTKAQKATARKRIHGWIEDLAALTTKV